MRVAYILLTTATATVSATPSWTTLKDTDFPGNNIGGSAKTDTVEACAQLCLSTWTCASASWNGPESTYKDNNCNLHCRGDNPSKSTGEFGVLINGTNLCGLPPPPHKVPDDWLAAYRHGDLLYTTDEAGVKYRPEVGNGFVASVVGSDKLFVAGVFNGHALDPSHRAEVPAPLALALDGQVTGAALDIRGGNYRRQYSINAQATAQLRFYAHRSRPSLLVADLSVDSNLGSSVTVQISGGGTLNPQSKDFAWNVTQQTVSGIDVIVWSGETLKAELPTSAKTRVAVVLPRNMSGPTTLANGSSKTFVVAVRTSLESEDPNAAALKDWEAAMVAGGSKLYAEHSSAWDKMWESGLEVSGRMDVARAVNSSLYYILSSLREDAVYSLSPGGLASNGYNGHTFWDCETWMYPSLVLWHPNLAASLLQYRVNRVDEAKQKALSYNKGYVGAMFPWESAATGAETCPTWAATGQLEQHITGDIAFAVQQYWYATHNASWLDEVYPSLLAETAKFWVSRVEKSDSQAHIRHVIPPDEYATGDDSVYTNFVAQRNLIFATEAATALGKTVDPSWLKVSEEIPMLFDTKLGIHPEFQGYHGQKNQTSRRCSSWLSPYDEHVGFCA